MRLPFLALTPASLSPAFAYVYRQQPMFDGGLAAAILIAALSAHISVNMFNEYFDFRSGLDAMTKRTPFSGGSGALISSPHAANHVLVGAWVSLILTMLVGAYFTIMLGPAILPVGLIGIIIILTYTSWLNRSPLLCLIAPGLAFGPLMTCGAVYVMSGVYSFTALIISLPLFFMANNLLLLNQIPDIDADRSAGRRHIMIQYGIDAGLTLYLIFIFLTALVLCAAVALDQIPAVTLPALLPVAVAVFIYVDIRRRLRAQQNINPALAMNVAVSLLTPVFIATGILAG